MLAGRQQPEAFDNYSFAAHPWRRQRAVGKSKFYSQSQRKLWTIHPLEKPTKKAARKERLAQLRKALSAADDRGVDANHGVSL